MASGIIAEPKNNQIPGIWLDDGDLNNVKTSGGSWTLVNYVASTLNTPYKAGLTGDNANGCVISNGSSNGFQFAIAAGRTDIFIRALSNGTWGSWRKI